MVKFCFFLQRGCGKGWPGLPPLIFAVPGHYIWNMCGRFRYLRQFKLPSLIESVRVSGKHRTNPHKEVFIKGTIYQDVHRVKRNEKGWTSSVPRCQQQEAGPLFSLKTKRRGAAVHESGPRSYGLWSRMPPTQEQLGGPVC